MNIAVAGIRSPLRGYIVSSLQANGYTVSVLTNKHEASLTVGILPPGVREIPVDFLSPRSLQEALKAQDGVISCCNKFPVDMQIELLNAAVAVGVKRFVPPHVEFPGHVPPSSKFAPCLKGTETLQEAIKAMTTRCPDFSWTRVVCGALIDWMLVHAPCAQFIDIANRKATIVDSGNAPFSGTMLSDVGEAFALIFKNQGETKNRDVEISSITTTRNDLIWALKQRTTADSWDIEKVYSEIEYKKGRIAYQATRRFEGSIHMLTAEYFGDRSHGRAIVGGKDNKLLGVRTISVTELARQAVDEVTRLSTIIEMLPGTNDVSFSPTVAIFSLQDMGYINSKENRQLAAENYVENVRIGLGNKLLNGHELTETDVENLVNLSCKQKKMIKEVFIREDRAEEEEKDRVRMENAAMARCGPKPRDLEDDELPPGMTPRKLVSERQRNAEARSSESNGEVVSGVPRRVQRAQQPRIHPRGEEEAASASSSGHCPDNCAADCANCNLISSTSTETWSLVSVSSTASSRTI